MVVLVFWYFSKYDSNRFEGVPLLNIAVIFIDFHALPALPTLPVGSKVTDAHPLILLALINTTDGFVGLYGEETIIH